MGRALQRYRRGHVFESRSSPNIFFRLNFRNCLSCVYNCDDHSLIRNLLRRIPAGMTAPKVLHLFKLQPGLDLFGCCSGFSLSEETEESALPSAILELRSCTIFGILTQDTHAGNVLTSGTSIFGIFQHMIPNRSKLKRLSSEILVNFKNISYL